SQMAHLVVPLEHYLKPLMTLIRESQNGYDYLQADETRIQVLKEDGKTAQSDKWMWVTCGGPPDEPSILFEYDPSRAGRIIERLLDGFSGVLQADGYSGYGKLCTNNGLTRIGCWDHVRRKFVEARKIALPTQGSANDNLSMADIALQKIGQLYAIERQIKEQTPEQKRAARQANSLPRLNELKAWLEDKAPRLLKGSQTRKAMEYALNQWPYLIGYCEDGRLNMSNIKVENAIRPFAVGRRAWLFADTAQGAQASATIYSLIETAKANGLEPYAYFLHLLNHIGAADSVEAIEALLPWNVAALLNSPK
ncbi:MAG: IS66 family transposase, partial [Methylomonas sp.]|nr:IS66 family transposase [Methylomonas sp.]